MDGWSAATGARLGGGALGQDVALTKRFHALVNQVPDVRNADAQHLADLAMVRAHAWEIRGGKFVPSIQKERMQRFGEHMQRFLEILTATAGYANEDMAWYSYAIHASVEVLNSKAEARRYLDLATEAYPGAYEFYIDVARGYLPQWGGSIREIKAYLAWAKEDSRDTLGNILEVKFFQYFRNKIASLSNSGRIMKTKPGDAYSQFLIMVTGAQE